jgi:hypothetical protein
LTKTQIGKSPLPFHHPSRGSCAFGFGSFGGACLSPLTSEYAKYPPVVYLPDQKDSFSGASY